jgi:hypothetical protein
MNGVQSPTGAGRNFSLCLHCVRNCSVAHPAFWSLVTEGFFSDWSVKLTAAFNVVLRFRIRGALLPSSIYAFIEWCLGAQTTLLLVDVIAHSFWATRIRSKTQCWLGHFPSCLQTCFYPWCLFCSALGVFAHALFVHVFHLWLVYSPISPTVL